MSLCDLCLLPRLSPFSCPFFFFFNDTATTEIYTLSLHDALPICLDAERQVLVSGVRDLPLHRPGRSEEHTSELQSRVDLVCRLLLEKKIKISLTLYFRNLSKSRAEISVVSVK